MRKTLFSYVLYIAAAALAYFLLRYGITYIFPAAAALIMAFFIRPIGIKIKNKTGIPISFSCGIIIIVVTATTCFAVISLCSILIEEFIGLYERLNFNFGNAGELVQTVSEFIGDKIPFLEGIINADRMLSVLPALMSPLIESLPDIASDFPSFVFGGVVSVILCWYICTDYDALCESIRGFLPLRIYLRLVILKNTSMKVIKSIFGAYGLIFILDVVILFVGFVSLGQKYTLALCFICGFLDILPAIGCGIILIPCGIVSLILGDRFLGFGLIILYAAVTLVHQAVEPHLLGKGIGIHPAITLFGAYIGMLFAGAAGVLIVPTVLGITVTVYKNFRENDADKNTEYILNKSARRNK